MEHQLFTSGEFPFTPEWYTTREHAPHLEQGIHHARMEAVAKAVAEVVDMFDVRSIVDLGCGDGGMLTLMPDVKRWGYDLMATNIAYGKDVRHEDVRFGNFWDGPVEWAHLTVITECLEHLEDPHAMVDDIAKNSQLIVASSPVDETPESHDACHAWCWDMEGYAALLEANGAFQVLNHERVEGDYAFQVIVGESLCIA